MKRAVGWAGLAGGLLAAAVVLWPEARAPDLPDTPDAVEAWLAAHPDRYAVAAWDVGDEAHGLFHDADTAWPLASTVKIIHLALASEEIAAGRWSLEDPTPEVADFYLAGTDGDAHPEAEKDRGTATLGAALFAMIRHSDNAATDAIAFRLGRERFVNDAGLPRVHPLTGTSQLVALGFDGGSVDDEAWRRASALRGHPLARPPLGTLEEQRTRIYAFDNRGSARAIARLIERIFTDDGSTYAVAREVLQWPMAFPSNQQAYRVFGAKGGSWTGILTNATYAETRDGRRRVFVLLMHHLPDPIERAMSRNFAHHSVAHRALQQPDGLTRLKVRWGL